MPTDNYNNRSVVVRVPDFGIARGQDGLSAYEQAVAGGYEGTEAQFNQELSSFNTLHDETETAATAAAESATSAGQSATAAAGSAESAASSASSSATSAADASASAGSAADSASNAASSAASAASSADSADSSASTATQKASEASASATAASASETNAASSEDAAADSAAAAAASAAAIEEYEHDAEAWAIGKRGGQDVPSTDATYHNNSKYYADQAGTSASTAASSAAAASTSENNSASSASSAAASASSASTSAATATEKAGEASTSASSASTSAANAAGSATNAASSATAASASATAAGNAQTAAETAQGKAEDAQEAAETAAQSVSKSAEQIATNTQDIDALKSAFDLLTSDGVLKNAYDFDWTVGYINSSTGEINTTDYPGWRVSKPIPANEFYSLYISTPNPIEVYAYNSDDSYNGRKNNLVAGIEDYQPVAGYLGSAAYCRLLTTAERAALVNAYYIEKALVTISEFEESIENNNKVFTVLFSEDGYLDLTNNLSIGGISGSGVVEPNDTRYLCTPNMIKIQGENIRLVFSKSDFTVEACFYKADGSWWGRYPSTAQSADTVITVPAFLQYQYYVRFMFRPVVPTNFAVTGIPNDIGVRIKNYPTEKTNNNIKVLSYNLRCLKNFSNADPDTAPLTDPEIKTCIEAMANYIGGVNPDLFIACEDRQWFDAPQASDISGGTKSVYNMLWSHWFPYKFDTEYGITVPRLYSKYPIIYGRREDVTYPAGVQSVRPISTCLIYINDAPIWIIPVHATAGPDAYETDRVPYFNAIVNFCADKDRVILAGDFNTDTSTPADELQVFVNAGFSLGNHGLFGDKKTYISGEGYTMNRLDNIITKGLTLNNFIVDSDIEYSDHYPVHSAITLSV